MAAYIDIDPVMDSLFDPTVINPPSLVRSALYETTGRKFYSAGVFYRWMTDNSEIKYPFRDITSDPWLDETLNKIASFRGAADNWDGYGSVAPDESLFATAEKIAESFSKMEIYWRPTLNFDPDGHPNFAAYNDDIYLTLTVDAIDRISWYAVRNGQEYFRENIDMADFDSSIFVNDFEVA
ncbi:hypothetical protein [Brucella pseudintermedia]|uniref:hypothetical protein n=1 Tax=Brucella pseudintermedia TaxID=370111 RepID=UPI0030F3AD48